MDGKAVFESSLHNGNVIPGQLQLILQRDDAGAFVDALAQIFGQCIDHLGGFVVFLIQNHPFDDVQGVVKKMRLDLSLQGLHLGFRDGDLIPVFAFHQVLYGQDDLVGVPLQLVQRVR